MTDSLRWPDVIAAELETLAARDAADDGTVRPRDRATTGYLTGLALSGGGIRSAAVSLGMLQVLAEEKLLKHFDYLSTVSGGGYIGSALALRYAQLADARADAGNKPGRVDPDAAFPYPEDDPEVTFFRHHGNYLAPSGFGSLATGFYVVARSVLLNLFIWIVLGGILLALLMGVGDLVGIDLWLTRPRWDAFAEDGHRRIYELFFWAGALCAGVLVAALVGVSLSSWWVQAHRSGEKEARWQTWVLLLVGTGLLVLALRDGHPIEPFDYIEMAGPVLLLLAIGVPALFSASARRRLADTGSSVPISVKYARRRSQERLAGYLLVLAAAFLVLAAIPVLSDLLVHLYGSVAGPSAVTMNPYRVADAQVDRGVSLPLFLVCLGSGAAALYGFYRTHLKGELGVGTAAVVIVGSVVLVFGALMIANQVAVRLFDAGWPWTWWNPDNENLDGTEALVAVVSALAAIALAVFVNVNDISLSRFYRDRLMEAFMPNRPKGGMPVAGAASDADRYRLCDVAARTKSARPRRPIGPYPLINTYMVARRFRSRPAGWGDTVRRRGGDSFVLSPGFSGSTVTGWRRTTDVLDNQLTVPTAMAISGAAVNPGGGLAGRGVTTNYATAVAMSLLSLRLGYRFRWNGSDTLLGKARRWCNPFGNHLIPGASELILELLGVPSSDKPGFIELSDGGHFDNLGVYELIRRRCGLIVVCDGGEDPAGSYEAFTSVMTMIREDFGVKVDVDRFVGREASGPAGLVARPRSDEYPKAAEFAKKGFFLATLTYGTPTAGIADRETVGPARGLVIYMKATMLRGLGLPSRGYKGANPAFPYEPTSDQFFSPEQFEAYRDVGRQITRQMLVETGLADLLGPDATAHQSVEAMLAVFEEGEDGDP